MKKHSMKSFLKSWVALMLCLCIGGSALADVLTLPAGVRIIEEEAFYGDESLDEVVLPDGVERIEERAFADSSVTKVNLPDSLEYIAENAFDAEADIEFSAKNPSYAYNWLEARNYHIEEPSSPVEDFVFTYRDGTCQVSKYIGTDTEIVIPDEDAEGNAVTGIYSSAFRQQSNIQSIKIPEGVTSIGIYAFTDCSSLKTVKLPDSLISIGNFAFMRCGNLEKINIPGNVSTIGKSALSYCSSLIRFDIPDKVESIDDYTFRGCSNLKAIEIPNSVKSIGEYAFSGCSSLTTIEIPTSVVSIGKFAFFNCNNLEDVNLSEGIETIGSRAFTQCAISTIFLPDSLTHIENDAFDKESGIVFSANEGSYAQGWIQQWLHQIEYSDYNFIDNGDGTCTLKNYTGDDTVIVIPAMNAEGLPVTIIGSTAFYFNSTLTDIKIPDTVNAIGDYAFYNCSALTDVTLSNNLTNIGEYAFSNCNSLNVIMIPDSTISISGSAFDGCGANRIATIGSDGAKALSKAGYSFRVAGNTCDLKYVYADDEIIDLEVVDADQNAANVSIPEGVTKISSALFCFSNSLTEITLPGTLKIIGSSAFKGCSQLEFINLPEGLITIENEAFYECRRLMEIDFPDSLVSIGHEAFYNCTGFTAISIPQNVTNIASHAFYGCDVDMFAIIGSEGAKALSKAGYKFRIPDNPCEMMYLFEEEVTDLYVTVSTTAERLIVPDGVTVVGCIRDEKLMGITLPGSVKKIDNHAFDSCGSLKSIALPQGVTSIGEWAFSQCSSLTNIDIPETLTSIGDYAFYYCTNLTNIMIPDGLTSLGVSSFSFCSAVIYANLNSEGAKTLGMVGYSFRVPGEKYNLQYMYIDNINTGIEISNVDQDIVSFTVPEYVTHIKDYAFNGCSSMSDITIPESVISIGARAFMYCSSLKEIQIPDNLSMVGWGAFDGCNPVKYAHVGSQGAIALGKAGYSFRERGIPCDLKYIWVEDEITDLMLISADETVTSIIIPEGVTSIGNRAFYEHSSLSEIHLPESLTSIGDFAFYMCSQLRDFYLPDFLTSIGDYAFYGCGCLKDIMIPPNVTIIGTTAFYNCGSLETVIMSENVTSIGEFAFDEQYSNINQIYCVESSYAWGWFVDNGLGSKLIPWDGDTSSLPQRYFRIYGSFTNRSMAITLGDPLQTPAAKVKSIGAPIHRVTLTINDWNQDGTINNRYRTHTFEGKNLYNVSLTDPEWASEYVLDTTQPPLNEPGEYIINLWADLEEDSGVKLDSMTVSIIDSETDHCTVSGKVMIGSIPVESVYVYALTGDNQIENISITDKNGQWSMNLTSSYTYNLEFYLSGYDVSSGNTTVTLTEDTDIGTVTLTASGTQDDSISFTMSSSNIMVGTSVHFDITCSLGDVVRLVVDDKPYEYVNIINGFDRVFNKAGERKVQFSVEDSDGNIHISNAKTLVVTVIDPDNPDLTSPLINSVGDQYIDQDFEISWGEVTNATSYTVYVYSPYGRVWPTSETSKVSTTSTTSILIPGTCLMYAGNYTIDVIAAGEGYNQATGAVEFTVYDTAEDVDISLPKYVDKIYIGDQISFNVTSRFDSKDYTYVLSCDRPDDVEIKENQVVFQASGNYIFTAAVTHGETSYTSMPLSIKVEDGVVTLKAEAIENNILRSYGSYFWEPVGTEIIYRLTTNFIIGSVKVIKDGTDYSNKLNIDEKLCTLTVTPTLANSKEQYIFTVTDAYGKSYDSVSVPVYVMQVTNNKETDYRIKPNAELFKTPETKSSNTHIDYAPVTAVSYKNGDGNYEYNGMKLVSLNGTEYFVNTEDCLTEDQISGGEGILSIEENFTGNIVYTVQDLLFTVKADTGVTGVNAQVIYTPASKYHSGEQIVKTMEPCDLVPGTNQYTFQTKFDQCGQYNVMFYPIAVGNSELKPLGLDPEVYSIKGEDERIVYEVQWEDYELFADPRELELTGNTIQYTTPLYVIGDAGNDMLYVFDGSNSGFIYNGFVDSSMNPVSKRALIFASKELSYGFRADGTSQAINFAKDLFRANGCQLWRTRFGERGTRDQFVSDLLDLGNETDFNDIAYIYIDAHGNQNYLTFDTSVETEAVGYYTGLSFSSGYDLGTGLANMISSYFSSGDMVLILDVCNSGSFETAINSVYGWDSARFSILAATRANESDPGSLWGGMALIRALYNHYGSEESRRINLSTIRSQIQSINIAIVINAGGIRTSHPTYLGDNGNVVFYN